MVIQRMDRGWRWMVAVGKGFVESRGDWGLRRMGVESEGEVEAGGGERGIGVGKDVIQESLGGWVA
jgi:hypothetical protein